MAERETREVRVVNGEITKQAAMSLAKAVVQREGFYPVLITATYPGDFPGWRVTITGECDCGKGIYCPQRGEVRTIEVSETELAALWGDR